MTTMPTQLEGPTPTETEFVHAARVRAMFAPLEGAPFRGWCDRGGRVGSRRDAAVGGD